MKNKKGEIATLLTLGLVLVGGIITLASSFFINNQKNIALNSKADAPKVENCIFAAKEACNNNYLKVCKNDTDCVECANKGGGMTRYRCPEKSDDSQFFEEQLGEPLQGEEAAFCDGQNECGSNGAYDCKLDLGCNYNACKDKGKTRAFGCWVKNSTEFFGCLGSPCSAVKISGTSLVPESGPFDSVQTCKGGSYNKPITNCEEYCGVGLCQPCVINGITKYECIITAKPPPNLGACVKLRTYKKAQNCINDPESEDDTKCTQCMYLGAIRYEYGGPGPTQGAFPKPTINKITCVSPDYCANKISEGNYKSCERVSGYGTFYEFDPTYIIANNLSCEDDTKVCCKKSNTGGGVNTPTPKITCLSPYICAIKTRFSNNAQRCSLLNTSNITYIPATNTNLSCGDINKVCCEKAIPSAQENLPGAANVEPINQTEVPTPTFIIDQSCHLQNCSNVTGLQFAYKCKSYQNVEGVKSCNGTSYYKTLSDCNNQWRYPYDSEESACGSQYTNITIEVDFQINNNIGAYEDKVILIIFNNQIQFKDPHDFYLSNLKDTSYIINGPTTGLECSFNYAISNNGLNQIPCAISILNKTAEVIVKDQ